MSLNVAVQMDPIERINIAGDSSFAMMLEAQARGHKLFYYTPDKLSMRDGRVTATIQHVTVQDVKGAHFDLGEPVRRDLQDMDVVLLRQDPPFDLGYITTTHILERIHPKTLVVNNPAQVRNAPEKIFVTRVPRPDAGDADHARQGRDRGLPRRARRDRDEAALRKRRRCGVQGRREGPRISGRCSTCSPSPSASPGSCQRFLPEVSEGDKRIILVDGVPMGAVNRVPAANDIRSNMVRGGAAETTQLSDREREICDRIGPSLKAMGLIFVGIDVIAGNLTEINVTSPTGLRAIKRLGGPDLAVSLWECIEDKVGG